jgi:integral membrane sensor domain MASE1
VNTSTPSSRESLEQFGVLVGLFFAYVIGARIGLDLHAVNDFATLIWPPSGIALAGFLLYGFRVWPAVSLAAFLVNFSNGAPLLVATMIGIGNTLGTAAGAFFIKEYSNYTPSALRVRDSIAVVAGALIAPIIAAVIGVTALWLGGQLPAGQFGVTWQTWFIGDMVGILVYTPLILKWWNRGIYDRTRAQQIELLLAVLASALTAYYVFWIPSGGIVYYLFIPLTWAALRTGPRGTTLSIFVIAVIAIWGTLSGLGPFVTEGLLQMRLFIGITSGVLLIIAALVEERRNALKELESHVKELEVALEKIHSEDEAKKKFLTVLAHELRNPLATILSSIELIYMENRTVPPAMKSSLETIGERSRAMVHLLDDLLDISRVSHKKLRLHKELVLIDHFIDRLVLSVQPIMRRYGHT